MAVGRRHILQIAIFAIAAVAEIVAAASGAAFVVAAAITIAVISAVIAVIIAEQQQHNQHKYVHCINIYALCSVYDSFSPFPTKADIISLYAYIIMYAEHDE